jgi:hypothetical protein
MVHLDTLVLTAPAKSVSSFRCRRREIFPFCLYSMESASDQNGNCVELDSASNTSSRGKTPCIRELLDRIFVQPELQSLSIALACHHATGDLLAPNWHRSDHLRRTPHPFDHFMPPAAPWNSLVSPPKDEQGAPSWRPTLRSPPPLRARNLDQIW